MEGTMHFTPDPALPDPRVVHADDWIVVADKPSGLHSVPGKGEEKADSAIGRLGRVFPGIRLVHRLDRDTSGVMVFARTHPAQAALGRQFEGRSVEKTYVARLAGQLAGDSGEVDLPLCVDWPNRPRQHVDHANGRPARTLWRVIGRAEDETRVELRPLTGRSHQLRVHMAALGHPILGDTLYAGEGAQDHPRLMLHAAEIVFDHPGSGARVSYAAPPPF
jgi:tRNA pseudouridine32 synthase/23S rRNA pseudouridine746 synthase